MNSADLVIIGGGPAGLAAAIEAHKNGVGEIVIIERDRELGGILQQCIHNGFGLHYFGEELTGPEYAGRFIEQVQKLGIIYKLDTMVLKICKDKVVTVVNSQGGLVHIKAAAIVLAMGCRERTRGALNIPGMRPAGIYTAGTAQRFVNMEGYLPGKKVVILGSGDIGLIMARRMTLEGAEVKMVCELLPYPGGLTRNIVQCLEDYNIPLKLNCTVIQIHGKERLEGITVAKVDQDKKPILGTEEYVECDALLLSVGLIPENELTRDAGIEIDPVTSGPIVNESMETSVEGIFACGNVVHVHDLVDYATQESQLAGRCAAQYIVNKTKNQSSEIIRTIAGNGIRYVVPQIICKDFIQEESKLFFRVTEIHKNKNICVKCGDKIIYSKKKAKLVPGEMENIKLSKQHLMNMSQNQNIVVELASKEGNKL